MVEQVGLVPIGLCPVLRILEHAADRLEGLGGPHSDESRFDRPAIRGREQVIALVKFISYYVIIVLGDDVLGLLGCPVAEMMATSTSSTA
jgi:hypothetical protein